MSHGADASGTPQEKPIVTSETHGAVVTTARIFALTMTVWAFFFVANNVLNFWFDWPGAHAVLGWAGLFGFTVPDSGVPPLAWVQFAVYVGLFALAAGWVLTSPARTLHEDADVLGAVAGYIIRWAFWSVLLIGFADGVISFLRVEGFLVSVVGSSLAEDLGRPIYRGHFVHYPLLVIALVIAAVKRTLGFPWLAVLIVAAELMIVIARFVFSYEQAFMADLVRFWYGALFLFASPYTLITEGHVRVDILYTGFTRTGKAMANAVGCLFLGLPLCWVILTFGLWGKANAINGPLLTFEVTQSGYGLYTKYLLAGYLLVFALSMLIQFMSYLLSNVATLLHEPGYEQDLEEHTSF